MIPLGVSTVIVARSGIPTEASLEKASQVIAVGVSSSICDR
jgi:hypothetical protein